MRGPIRLVKSSLSAAWTSGGVCWQAISRVSRGKKACKCFLNASSVRLQRAWRVKTSRGARAAASSLMEASRGMLSCLPDELLLSVPSRLPAPCRHARQIWWISPEGGIKQLFGARQSCLSQHAIYRHITRWDSCSSEIKAKHEVKLHVRIDHTHADTVLETSNGGRHAAEQQSWQGACFFQPSITQEQLINRKCRNLEYSLLPPKWVYRSMKRKWNV